MRHTMKKSLCWLLTLLLVWVCAPAVVAATHQVSSVTLSVGDNAVTAVDGVDTTLYVFQPENAGAFTVSVSNSAAVLTYWHGSKFFVSGLAAEAVDGVLTITCSSVGQPFLIGLSGVKSAVITITEQEGYVPPSAVVYEAYENKHTIVSDFAMPDETLTRVNIMKPQTLVADADGIYHLGSVTGPILYVNMCAAVYADLYACYYPTGGTGALYMRGTYLDESGNKCGYEVLEAMRPYADALDADGYYYLTVDLAVYIQTYGQNQGWFNKSSSPFSLIKQGRFIEESAWLVNAYYVEPPAVVAQNGDANGDGKVNNRDLGLLQQHLNDWEVQIDLTVCDLDGNGKVNNRDLGLLQQLLNQ